LKNCPKLSAVKFEEPKFGRKTIRIENFKKGEESKFPLPFFELKFNHIHYFFEKNITFVPEKIQESK